MHIVDIASGEELPKEIYKAMLDERVIKTAFNAAFERICLQKYIKIRLPVNQWQCSMIAAAELGLPLSLKEAAKAVGAEEQKDSRGKALINYFCKPHAKGRHMPADNPQSWQEFKQYGKQDVRTERALRNKLKKYHFSGKRTAIMGAGPVDK